MVGDPNARRCVCILSYDLRSLHADVEPEVSADIIKTGHDSLEITIRVTSDCNTNDWPKIGTTIE